MQTCQRVGIGINKMDGEGLISQNVLDDYWEMATSEMLSVLRAHCVCHTCTCIHIYVHLY